MKKILFFICILLVLPFMVNAETVSIENIIVKDKSGDSTNGSAAFDGYNVSFDTTFKELNSYIIYEVDLVNKDNYKIGVELGEVNDEYVKYEPSLDGNKLYIKMTYIKEPPYNDGVYTNESSIDLLVNLTSENDSNNEENQKVSPETGASSIVILVGFIFVLAGILGLSFVYNKKVLYFTPVLFVAFIGLNTLMIPPAYSNVSFKITNKITINKSIVSFNNGFSLVEDYNQNKTPDVGDILKIDGTNEEFYVISNKYGRVAALAKYNLNAGGESPSGSCGTAVPYENPTYLQDESMLVDSYLATSFKGVIETSVDYMSGNLKIAFDNYLSKLYEKGYFDPTVKFSIRPMTLQEAKALGCNDDDCNDAPSWVTSNSYWLYDVDDADQYLVYLISNGKFIFSDDCSCAGSRVGARPVIEFRYDPNAHLMCDVNLDNEINNTDAEVILEYTVGGYPFTDEQRYLADVDLDGFVNVIDAVYIQDYIQGKQNNIDSCGY